MQGRRLRPATAALGLACCTLAACLPDQTPPPTSWREPATGLEFVRVPSGTFSMGSPLSEAMREPQEVLHRVILTESFYLGRHEVTQAQWQRLMGSNPSHFLDCGPDCPVENVSFVEIQRFLVALEALTGERFRLPTEAEWEYACRAGTGTVFGIGDHPSSRQANFDGREPYPGAEPGPYRAQPSPVGSFPPNAWGLHDMNGNVWEWCEDEHCPYPDGAVSDPVGECRGARKIIRGGSWYFGPDSARCALRYTHRPVDDGPSLGFRLVWTPTAG